MIKEFLDLLYPPNIYCLCCGAVIDGEEYGLCQTCIKSIRWANNKTCHTCGKVLQDWYVLKECTDCRDIDHIFDKGYTCAVYDDMTKPLIHGLKYGGKGYIAQNLATILADRLVGSYQTVVPVPMHEKKKKSRGYNQAELMAKYLAIRMGLPMDTKSLIRGKKTQVMAKLSAHERRQNMFEAFEVALPENFAGKKILLVDDVYTTGSTADGCAKALKEAGANIVHVVTFAAGQNAFKNQGQVDG